MNRHLVLLSIAQGLFLTNNVTFIAINGLVGLSLAPAAWMATLPVMGYVVGGALSTGLVAKSQQRWGRQGSFQLGLLVALINAGQTLQWVLGVEPFDGDALAQLDEAKQKVFGADVIVTQTPGLIHCQFNYFFRFRRRTILARQYSFHRPSRPILSSLICRNLAFEYFCSTSSGANAASKRGSETCEA